MFLFQVAASVANSYQSYTNQYASSRTSTDQSVRNQVETTHRPISNDIYRAGNESKRDMLFSYFGELNESKRDQLRQALYALFSQDLRSQLEALLSDKNLQEKVMRHIAFHTRGFGLSDPLMAGNSGALQTGLSHLRQEAMALGLEEGAVINDVIKGVSIKLGTPNDNSRAIAKYGKALLGAAYKADYKYATLDSFNMGWFGEHYPIAKYTPSRTPMAMIASMISDAQKMLQQAADNRETYKEAKEALEAEKEAAKSRFGAFLKEKVDADPANASSFMEGQILYAIETAKKNEMSVQQLTALLNGQDEQNFVLYTNPNFKLGNTPVLNLESNIA
jgi:hypothetical protein